MATGDDFPLRQGAGTWPRLFFRGYRGLRRRNFWSRVISDGFSIFRTFLALVSREDGPRGGHSPPGQAGPTRRAPVSCALLLHLLVLPRSFGGLFCSKKIVKKFQLIWRTFISEQKNNTTVVLLKTTSVQVSSMQIIPKPYKIVVNMAWILHKL